MLASNSPAALVLRGRSMLILLLVLVLHQLLLRRPNPRSPITPLQDSTIQRFNDSTAASPALLSTSLRDEAWTPPSSPPKAPPLCAKRNPSFAAGARSCSSRT